MMAQRACGKSMDLRVLRTNRYLKEAFIRLLGRKSFEELTVQEICAEAGVRRTTFYQHFEDKQHFLAWFIREQQHEFTSFATGGITPDRLDEYYAQMMLNVLKYLNDNEKIVCLLRYAGVEGRRLIEAFSKGCIDEVTSHLESIPGIEEKLGGMPIPFLVEFYTGGLAAVARWWLLQDKPLTEDEMATFVQRIIHQKNIIPMAEN